MGYRLHYAQHFEPNWQGGYFNWKSNLFADLVRAEFETAWYNDDESEFELERDDIVAYVKKLGKNPNAKNKFLSNTDDPVTNKEMIEVFNEILKSDDNSIRLEWF